MDSSQSVYSKVPPPPTPPSQQKTSVLIIPIIAALLLGIASGWLLHSAWSARDTNSQRAGIHTNKYPADAPELFEKMVDQSLHTASMTEQRLLRDPSGKLLQKSITTYDLADVRNVRIFSTSHTLAPNNAAGIRAEYISVPEGTYMSYKELGLLPKDKLGHWFPLIEGGAVNPEGAALSLGDNPEAHAQSYMGFYIPGVFDLPTRNKMKQYIKQQELYQSFSQYVRPAEDNGKLYYTYKLDINPAKYVEFNKIVAQSLGKPLPTDVDKSASAVNGKVTFWINKDSARLERVDMRIHGLDQTIYYYDYNKDTNIQKPTPLAPAAIIKRDLEPEIKRLTTPYITDN